LGMVHRYRRRWAYGLVGGKSRRTGAGGNRVWRPAPFETG
jgi:hypothetical protein